jgi:uncharacterized protein YeaO (DUF488 family)
MREMTDAVSGPQVRVARIYQPPNAGDGTRVLVDRLWPRGLRKDAVHIDEWCKQVAPSNELRSWYGHDPARFEEFSDRYRQELQDVERSAALRHLGALAAEGTLTLLTASKALDISQAAVLSALLTGDEPSRT